MKVTKKMQVALAIGLLLSVISIGAVLAATASYIFLPSNTDTGNVNPTPSPSPSPTPAPITVNSGLVLSPKTVTFGQQWALTVTLTPPIAGKTVNFYEGQTIAAGVFVGSSVTDAAGTAALNIIAPIGSHTYIAQPQP